MLRKLADELWVAEQPLRFMRMEMGTRMTVARLAEGKLWVCSPITPSDALRRELDALGEVRFIVAPNRFHHLFLGPFSSGHSSARRYGSPGVTRKRKDLRFDAPLRDAGDADWGDTIDLVRVEGIPVIDEVAFLHRPSATLVLTDLLMQLNPGSPLFTRWFMRAEGVHERAGMPLSMRTLMMRDRAAFRRSVERILAWQFERIVIAHGPVVEQDGHALFERAMRWVTNGVP